MNMGLAAKVDLFGPDLLCDPSFVPCRKENCPRWDLHAEHEVTSGRRGPRKLDTCPRCQGPVVVTQTKSENSHERSEIKAECSCGWTFSNKNKPRTK